MARRGVWLRVRPRAWPLALVPWFLFVLSGCATAPELKPEPDRDAPQRPLIGIFPIRDSIDGGGRTYAVTRFTVDPERRVHVTTDEAVAVVTDGSEGSAATVTPDRSGDPATPTVSPGGAAFPVAVTVTGTPWRRAAGGTRVPVGIVIAGGRRISPPAPPYWALAFSDEHASSAYMLPQESLTGMPAAPNSTPSRTPAPPTALGGFYPLLLAGRPVAATYPGAGIRAARVAIAGYDDPDAPLTIVTVEGTRVLRPGVTTDELAHYLARHGYHWAINLDGGRSAAVTLPDGTTFPKNVPFRRPGPVRLHFLW